MAVIGSGGGEAREEEVEGHCPCPLFFGEHRLGTCRKCKFSSSTLGLLTGLAMTCGPQGKKY